MDTKQKVKIDAASTKMADTARYLILKAGTQQMTLADLLMEAYEAGYHSAEFDGRSTAPMPEPDASSDLINAHEGRALLRQALRDYEPAVFLNAAAEAEWEWNDELAGWVPMDMDCLIRPGKDGLIVMEAAGEFAGRVVVREGAAFADFPEGTFR